MALIPYTKPHATPEQRVAHLRSKGLLIPKPKVAAQKIEMIGYERLRIYFLSRRQVLVVGKPFSPNVSYKDIIRLYECDLKIREAVFVVQRDCFQKR
jgi:abortive infection bacteriophage resistance protein